MAGPKVTTIDPADNVGVAVSSLTAGGEIGSEGSRVTVRGNVPAGHKVAVRRIAEREPVVKYGFPIERLETALETLDEYRYQPERREASERHDYREIALWKGGVTL